MDSSWYGHRGSSRPRDLSHCRIGIIIDAGRLLLSTLPSRLAVDEAIGDPRDFVVLVNRGDLSEDIAAAHLDSSV